MTTNKALEVAREIAKHFRIDDQFGRTEPLVVYNPDEVAAIIDQALQSEWDMSEKLAEALGFYAKGGTYVISGDSVMTQADADKGRIATFALAAYSAHRGVKA